MRLTEASRALQFFDEVDDHSGREEKNGTPDHAVGPGTFSGCRLDPKNTCEGAND